MPQTPEQQRKRRRRAHEAGVCTKCFQRPMEKNSTRCTFCIDQDTRMKQRRRDEGSCVACGGARDDPDRANCVNCTQLQIESNGLRSTL